MTIFLFCAIILAVAQTIFLLMGLSMMASGSYNRVSIPCWSGIGSVIMFALHFFA